MRQGGAAVTFVPRTDANIGRIDITAVRTADQTGAAGSGLLAAILFDAIAPGSSAFTVSGVATDPAGQSLPLQFAPAGVTIR